MILTAQETAKYAEMWGVESYAAIAPGERYLHVLSEHCPAPARILDAGTGSGKGALALQAAGYQVTTCDLTSEGLVEAAFDLPFTTACLWRPLAAQGLPPVEAVYCTDVLEHIPTQFTMLAVREMLAIARQGVCLSVSLQPDAFGVYVGEALHQTVKPFTWWRDSLREVARVRDARDLIGDAVFWVETR